MQDFEDISVVSTYAWMRVDDVTTNYQLHIGRYSGLGGKTFPPMLHNKCKNAKLHNLLTKPNKTKQNNEKESKTK